LRRLALAHVVAVPACAVLLACGVIQHDVAPLLASFGVAVFASFGLIAWCGAAEPSTPVAALGSAEAEASAPHVTARGAK
jgi:hypothetical protein